MTSHESELVGRIVEFVKGIGIAVRFTVIEEPTFLPGLTIEQSEIVVDEARLGHAGDILHEAGHVPVTAPDERAALDGKIELPDTQGGGYEMAAIAWSYAAAIHLQLDPSILFHEDGYKGDSQSLIENFAAGRYIGVPILQWAGMTLDEDAARGSGIEPYPHMIKWVG